MSNSMINNNFEDLDFGRGHREGRYAEGSKHKKRKGKTPLNEGFGSRREIDPARQREIAVEIMQPLTEAMADYQKKIQELIQFVSDNREWQTQVVITNHLGKINNFPTLEKYITFLRREFEDIQKRAEIMANGILQNKKNVAIDLDLYVRAVEK